MERTVEYSDDFMLHGLDKIPHSYKLYYLVGGKSFYSKEFPSYQIAFDKALDFATKIMSSDFLTDEDKRKVIYNLQVIDCDETRDVTTAELKNLLLDMLKDIR